LVQLRSLINNYDKIPFPVLLYLGSVINYGGRVTDDKDNRCIESMMKIYISQEAITDNYKYSRSGKYYSIQPKKHEDYMKYI